MVMGFAIRKHIQATSTGRKRLWGARAAGAVGILAALVFVGQIVGKWTEGGWVVLITFSVLVILANVLLLSPIGIRDPKAIHRIVRDKARVQGSMASIVEWQSLKMQVYRYDLLVSLSKFFEVFGIHRPVISPQPVPAGEYEGALHIDHPDAPSLLEQYLDSKPGGPKLGGAPRETSPGNEEGKED
jgi:hypothetical protein